MKVLRKAITIYMILAVMASVLLPPAVGYAAAPAKTVTASVKPGKVSGLKAKALGFRSVKVTWNKKSDANGGYRIYRATSKNGKYKLIKTVKAGVASYVDRSLKAGRTFYYKVAALSVKNGKKTRGALSSVASAKSVSPNVKNLTASSGAVGQVKLRWNKVSYAKGYVVYVKALGDSKYRKLTDTANTKAVYNGLKAGGKYHYKVRSYRTISGKRVYSSYSGVASATVKKSVTGYSSKVEKEVFDAINKARVAKGLDAYGSGSKNARVRAKQLADNFGHAGNGDECICRVDGGTTEIINLFKSSKQHWDALMSPTAYVITVGVYYVDKTAYVCIKIG